MSAALMAVLPLAAQKESQVRLFPDQAKQSIPKEIYGQFAEHLGTCIYGGLWVGENSAIPNTDGYRNDVLQALKDLKIPVLRWPGGCFADEYHWMDGIGPKENRPRMVNNNWGGTVEDNSFGTHEFLNLCELLECEPYVSMNVGSGTVQETAQWVEYMTAEDGPMAKLRKQNGREKPWRVKYIGVGNESWGCGGNMRPEYYADLYRRYQTYCRNYDGNRLFKIASGSGEYDLHWTETMMKQARNQMDGLSQLIFHHAFSDIPGFCHFEISLPFHVDIQKHLLLQSRHLGQCLTDDTKQFLMAQSLELIIRKTICRLLQFVFYLLEARPAAKIIHTLIINHREKQPDYISLAVQLFPLFQETQ